MNDLSSASLHSLPVARRLVNASGREQSSSFSSDQRSEGRMTPERRALEPFPDRWMRFLHSTCRNLMEAAVFYDVSEKTARKWWEGVGGCRGDKVDRAVELFPREANEILFNGAYAIAAE